MGEDAAQPAIWSKGSTAFSKVFFFLVSRQSQLAKMTSELCDGGEDEQRENEALAASRSSSVSPLSVAASLELAGPWSTPVSPVTTNDRV